MTAVTICSDFGAPKIKSLTVALVSPSICHEVMGPDAMILVFWMLSLKPGFSLFQLHQEALYFLFTFCLKGSIICISEVIDISPSNLDSSLCFIQSNISYDVLCMLSKQDDSIQLWHTSFPIWNQSVVPYPVLTIASWHVYRFPRRQIRWSDIPISWRIFHSSLRSTQLNFLA